MPAYLSPIGNEAQIDANGSPLVGGKIYTCLAGTTTPAATYTASDGLTPQANPIILNSLGLPANPLWLGASVAMKIVIKDANDVTIRTVDNVLGVGDPSSVTAQDQWVVFSGTPTYLSATSFSLAGDQTATFQVNRRLKTTNAGGTIYSTIRSSSFGAGITTVTIANDSGTLDAGLSAVYYGLLSYTNSSQPIHTGELIGMQVFTASGTYTPTPGTASVVVEVQAPGGGSGGAAATVAGQFSAGAAGGGGGYGRKRITSGFSGTSVIIGAVGSGGAAGNNAGTAGGTTSFGAFLSCTGGPAGGGGAAQAAPGIGPGGTASTPAGGTATGADFSRPGSSGQVSFSVSVTSGIKGAGGDAYFGAGGASGTAFNSVVGGAAGVGYGAGASGPLNINATLAAQPGQTGAPGIVIVWEYA